MRHKHYDMIVAKAENMELVVFYKLPCEEWWQPDSECEALPDEVEIDYFLCLPKHKEACLHWLNGGDVEFHLHGDSWGKYSSFKGHWDDESDFIDEDVIIRIKTNS
ncbi:hypothetical protein NVP1106O_04 [Vibrio phage 1.106.O._10N.286.51.F7]|nr:hypothetical protein NVP1106O_04 [Vibrio phage 1.106.O._10N.286.51.F7]